MIEMGTFFLMSLGKCPNCGKSGVGVEHRDDWVGESRTHCDWEKKDEEATAVYVNMMVDFTEWFLKKHPEWRELLAKT